MDAKTKNEAKTETEVLSFIQQAWSDSHDWHLVFEKVKREYNFQGHYIGDTVITFCAYRGYLRAMQWMRSPVSADGTPGAPCPWNKLTCAYAARNGYLEILEYLYEAEAPFGQPAIIHNNCKEFMATYRDSWKSGRFDLPLQWVKPAKH